jgi:8-oxo-dGTP diphosphatase
MHDDPYRYCPLCGHTLTPFYDEERIRLRCEHCNWIRYRNPTVGVAVILINKDGLWLGKRRQGGWCIPCGHVEWEETIEAAAKREALEETGLEVSLGKPFSIQSNFHDPDHHTVGIWFVGQASDFENAHPGGDLIDLRPFALDDLPQLAFPTDREVIRRLLTKPPSAIGRTP